MKIIFAISLSLVLLISLLLLTGHNGFAEKLAVVTFCLLTLSFSWALLRGQGGSGGVEGVGGVGNRRLKQALVFLGFTLPFVLVYKAFFLPGTLAWGDAPFFSSGNLKELFSWPLLWNFKDNNFGAPQYYILWLYWPTFLYGLLNHFLGLGNDLLIRLIFYLPATILGIIGAWLFIGRFTQNIWGKFLGSFLYGFNTYILMLVDGGQVGVALAYGLFPLTAVSVLGYLGNFSIRNYFLALITLFALVSSDVRIAVILVFFVSLCWGIRGIRGNSGIREEIQRVAIILTLLGVSVVGLSAYWIVPTITSSGLSNYGNLGSLSNENNFISLINSLFLFQPHFPLNQFGKTFPTPFYFGLLLPLILGSLPLISRFKDRSEKKMIFLFSLMFLFLVFLAKGGSDPLGQGYSWVVNNLPLGVAFRDSSKFYTPLILVGSLLLSFTVSALQKFLTKKLFIISVVIIYSYLLIAVYPSFIGNLSGVLGGLGGKGGVEGLENMLKNEKIFFRTLWFEEKPSQVYFSWSKPALSANNLHQERPFASMSVGKYDLFNYLHSPQICQWWDLLGVKYLFFAPSERKKILDMEEQQFQQQLLQLPQNISCLSPVKWGLSFPAYQAGQSKPLIFAQKRAYLVVGGEEIYQKLFMDDNFILANQGFIFAEDGRIDLQELAKVDSQSLVILFSDKDLRDLQMSYLTELMVSSNDALTQQWKVWGSSDYLRWKYELLKQDINTKEFDFGKGVALSTIPGEKMRFKIPVSAPGKYFLAIRFTNSLNGTSKVKIIGQEFKLQNPNPQSFKWEVIGPMSLTGNDVEVEVVNSGKFSVLNTLALIPENQLMMAEQEVLNLTQKYRTVFFKGDMEGEDIIPINYQQVNPTQYKITDVPEGPLWIVFSDHYDQEWGLNGQAKRAHFPFYAMINGFYLDGSPSDLTLTYLPQEKVQLSVAISLFSAGAIILVCSAFLVKRRMSKK